MRIPFNSFHNAFTLPGSYHQYLWDTASRFRSLERT